MAEVGAVASIAGLISLGLQLGECAVKLKRFFDQVEKAPEALRMLEIEIKHFSLLLQDVEAFRVQRAIAPSPSLLRCIYHCQIVTAKIVSYVRDIEGISKKYKLPGRVYAALRLHDVNALCKDMERAKTNLIIALQLLSLGHPAISISASSTTATQMLSIGHPGHYANESDPLGTCSEEQDDDTELEVDHQQATPVTKGQSRKFASSKRVFRLQVYLPWMLGQVVWDLAVWRSYSGWEMSFQCDNLIPWDSPVFYYAEKGDTKAVEALFREGKASPYDSRQQPHSGAVLPLYLCWTHSPGPYIEMNSTILSYMRIQDRILAAETMTEFNARPDNLQISFWFDYQYPRIFDLVEHHDMDILDFPSKSVRFFASVNWPLLQRNLIQFGHHWTGADWFSCFSRIPLRVVYRLDPADFIHLCSEGSGIEALVPLRNSAGESVVHWIAGIIDCLGWRTSQRNRNGWFQLLTSIISTPGGSLLLKLVSLEHKWHCGRTPFMQFLGHGPFPAYHLQNMIRTWQKFLDDAGVGLQRFLQWEMSTWRAFNYSVTFDWIFHPTISLSGLYQDELTGKLIGQFVAVIRIYQQLRPTPGAWPALCDVPRTICWAPRIAHTESTDNSWTKGSGNVEIKLKDPWMAEGPSKPERSARVWRWWPQRTRNIGSTFRYIYDEDEAHDIVNPPRITNSLRRTRSEPHSLVQAYSERSRIFAGGLRYCGKHTRWDFQNGMDCSWPPSKYDGGCDDERCCNRAPPHEPDWPDFDRVMELVNQTQTFVETHGARPPECGKLYSDCTPWSVAEEVHLDFRTVDGKRILEFAMGGEHWYPVCERFPDCEHAMIYLAALRRRKEDEERGIEVVLDRSWW